MEEFRWSLMVPIAAVVGAFTYIIVKTLANTRVRELEIRQRIAMIEKGLVPPPEVDPRGFDRMIGVEERWRDRGMGRSAGRHRRAGITLMAVGFGLMVLISFTGGGTDVGIGVGGFLVILGLGFFVNSLFESREPAPPGDAARPSNSTLPPPASS